MSAGNLYELPGGRHAIETDRSTRDVLSLMPLLSAPPWWTPTIEVARVLCTLLPSRYLHGAMPQPDYQETQR